MSDDVRRISLVYEFSECGWDKDGPVTANKMFPHGEGEFALMRWEDYERLRAEVDQYQSGFMDVRAENSSLRARIEELKLQRLQMNNEVPITTDKSATKGRLSVSYDAIDAAWRVMEDKNETTR